MRPAMLIDDLRKSSPLLSVGVLTSDMMKLGSEIELLEKAGIILLHIDVMDGCFWPKITVGSPFVQGIKTAMLKDVHLLINKPENHIESFAKAGADMITFPVETCGDVASALRKIGQMENANDPSRGILKGLSLNPETPIDSIKDVIDDVDIVLLLIVSPDAGADKFISDLPSRIEKLKKIKEDIVIFVDGGIKRDNIADVARMGADIIVTGSAVYDGKDPAGNAKFMMEAIKNKG